MADWRALLARIMSGPLLVRRTEEPKHPGAARVPWVGRTKAGVYVNADLALRNATVWACVRYLSQTVAQLPWHVLVARGPGGERTPSHPLNWLLNTRPNPEWSAFQFRETLTTWALLRGNGVAEIERDAVGRAAALWPIHPDRVTPRRDEGGALAFEVNNGAAPATLLPAADVFHLRGFGDGPWGVDVIQYAAQSIGWAQATALFGAEFFGNGINPQAVLSFTGGLSPEARDEAIRAIQQDIKRHGMAVVDNAAKIERWSIEPERAQFIATMQHQIEEICRWFGVPPHKVMHLLRATFSNIEHQAIEVVVDAITPWARRFELEADYKLFGQNRPGFYTKLNLNALMRGDAKSRGEFYKAMRDCGAFTPNMILALEDMNPIGAEGDKHVMQSQYTTLARIGEETAASAPPMPAQDPDDEEDEEAAEATAEALAALGARIGAHDQTGAVT